MLREATKERECYTANTDGTYTKQIRTEDNSLRLVVNDSLVSLTVGAIPIQDFSPFYIRVFAQIDALELPAGSKVAHLGGGMGWLPKMLLGYGFQQTIFEIDTDIVSFLQEGILNHQVTFVTGDWKEMISGTFDIIVYDIDEPIDAATLRAHLNENGKLYTLVD